MYNTKYRNNNKGKQPGSFKKYKSLRANAYQANSNNSNYRRLTNNYSSNSSSKPVDIPGPILQYKANADSNLSTWIEALQPILESLFGHLASFIATDKYYAPTIPVAPAVVPWTNTTDPGSIQRTIERANATEYAKELSWLEADKPRSDRWLGDQNQAGEEPEGRPHLPREHLVAQIRQKVHPGR